MKILIDINFKLMLKQRAMIRITDNGCTESWYYLKDIPGWIRQKYLRSIFNKKRRERAFEKLCASEIVRERMGAEQKRYEHQKEKEQQWLLKHNLC